MSLTPGSRSSGSSGPRLKTSSITSEKNASRSVMLSGMPSSEINSNSSVRISASARGRSAEASASRLRRLSGLRWTFPFSSRYPALGAVAAAAFIGRSPQVSEHAEEDALLLGLRFFHLVGGDADQGAREVVELRGEVGVVAHRQRHARIQCRRDGAVVAGERMVDAVTKRRLDLLGGDQVLLRHAVEEHLDALAAGAELADALDQPLSVAD